MMRDVYIKPPKEFNLPKNIFLKLLKPLYGMTDAGTYWWITMLVYHLEDLDMTLNHLLGLHVCITTNRDKLRAMGKYNHNVHYSINAYWFRGYR